MTLILLLLACVQPPVLVKESRKALGTDFGITVATSAKNEEEARQAIESGYAEVERLEAMMSEFRSDSEVSRVNASAGGAPVRVSSELLSLVQRAVGWCDATEGTLDVTFLPLGRLWDWHREPFRVPDEAAIVAARALVDCHGVEVDTAASTLRLSRPGMAMGLGAIAKGAIVDRVSSLLLEAGFANTLVNGGGDLHARGDRGDGPWIAGIQDPRGPRGRWLGSLAVRDRALVTSGDYERFAIVDGRRYGHILDPRTGRPSQGVESVSVMAASTEEADALATSLFVAGPEKGRAMLGRFPGVEVLLIPTEGRPWMTGGFTEVLEGEP